MRATTRMCGVSINTVAKLLNDLGTACAVYQNETLRNLKINRVQVDEIWLFCGSKQKNVSDENYGVLGHGDVWTWVAIDADTKLVPCWMVGKRDTEYGYAFIKDLKDRIQGRAQLTSDGLKVYVKVVEPIFGADVDFGLLHKLYGPVGGNAQERRYSGGNCCGAIKGAVCGDPDPKHISTSFVERQNLTMRMGMRRFTRLTNGFSKKLAAHENAIAIHYMYYNFGRIHKSLRVTPAMEAGVCDHVWTLEEIAKLAD